MGDQRVQQRGPVVRGLHDLHAVRGEQPDQPVPQEGQVLAEDNSHGSSRVTTVGPPAGLVTAITPSKAASRRSMPLISGPAPDLGGVNPTFGAGLGGTGLAGTGRAGPRPDGALRAAAVRGIGHGAGSAPGEDDGRRDGGQAGAGGRSWTPMVGLAQGAGSTAVRAIYELIMAFVHPGSSKTASVTGRVGRGVMVGSSPTAARAAPGTTAFTPPMPRGVPPHALPAGSLTQLARRGTWLATTPKRRVFPGRPEQVAHARRFVARVLDGCPVADDALLCASELASNAIRHTRSGRSGTFRVLVWRGQSSACVAVLDDGSDSTPTPAASQPGGSRNPGTACSRSRRWRPGGATTPTATVPPAGQRCGSGSTGIPPDSGTSLAIADR